eukprot:TRINITY_DN49258_c0_g1_i2.p1 TRINITY_DN49258_c0_g1~~TRINITY_DN49258_c0_g1_i2.p1  ORF type:complete len:456 (+),score=137.99 TRINITY_DN49258_c0_g1_i2:670-2037(+)
MADRSRSPRKVEDDTRVQYQEELEAWTVAAKLEFESEMEAQVVSAQEELKEAAVYKRQLEAQAKSRRTSRSSLMSSMSAFDEARIAAARRPSGDGSQTDWRLSVPTARRRARSTSRLTTEQQERQNLWRAEEAEGELTELKAELLEEASAWKSLGDQLQEERQRAKEFEGARQLAADLANQLATKLGGAKQRGNTFAAECRALKREKEADMEEQAKFESKMQALMEEHQDAETTRAEAGALREALQETLHVAATTHAEADGLREALQEKHENAAKSRAEAEGLLQATQERHQGELASMMLQAQGLEETLETERTVKEASLQASREVQSKLKAEVALKMWVANGPQALQAEAFHAWARASSRGKLAAVRSKLLEAMDEVADDMDCFVGTKAAATNEKRLLAKATTSWDPERLQALRSAQLPTGCSRDFVALAVAESFRHALHKGETSTITQPTRTI